MFGLPNEIVVALVGVLALTVPAFFTFLGTVVQKKRPDPIGTAAVRGEALYVLAATDRAVFEGIRDAIKDIVECVEDGSRGARRGIEAIEDLAKAIEEATAEARARRLARV